MQYAPDGFPSREVDGPSVTLPLFINGRPVTSGPEWEAYMARKRVETMLADRAALARQA